MAGLVTALSSAVSTMQQIQQLNAMGEEEISTQSEEGIDPQNDPSLNREKGGIEFNLEMNLTIGGLDIACSLKRGSDGSFQIGLVAQNDNGQSMEGLLGETPEQDQQASFSDEAWRTVQNGRQQITQALGEPSISPSQNQSNLNDLERRV